MTTPFTVQQWLGEQFVPLLFIGFSLLMGLAVLFVSAKSSKFFAGSRPFGAQRRDVCYRTWPNMDTILI